MEWQAQSSGEMERQIVGKNNERGGWGKLGRKEEVRSGGGGLIM